MKKNILSYRIGAAVLFLGGVTAVNILVLLICLWSNRFPAGMLMMLFILDLVLYGAGAYFWMAFIYKPYCHMKKLYGQFVDGQVFEELFEYEIGWAPRWDEVMKRMQHLLNKQDAIRMSKKQAEYLALQNQINPHFLYNALEAIRGDAICAGLDSVVDATEALSSFFRYSITGVDKLVTLEEEIENVQDYFVIQYYRFGDKMELKIDYPEEEVLHLKLPKLTLQPFVENAICHGLEQTKNKGVVSIKIETTPKKILIRIGDNGRGMPEKQVEEINDYLSRVSVSYVGETKKKKGSIAVKNVNSRIKLLFGEEYGVHIYSTINVGTDVMVTLPRIQRGDYEEGTAPDQQSEKGEYTEGHPFCDI